MRKRKRESHNTYRQREREREREEQQRTTQTILLKSDYIANFQVEKAESARLALELQQARLINLLLQVSLLWHSVRPHALIVKASCSSFRPHALVV